MTAIPPDPNRPEDADIHGRLRQGDIPLDSPFEPRLPEADIPRSTTRTVTWTVLIVLVLAIAAVILALVMGWFG